MSTINITEESVFKKFSSLKTDKSPGPNNLHPKVLYEIRDEIAGYLTELFEESVETRIVPFDWKSAQITVLQKKEPNVKYQTIDQCHSRVLKVKF